MISHRPPLAILRLLFHFFSLESGILILGTTPYIDTYIHFAFLAESSRKLMLKCGFYGYYRPIGFARAAITHSTSMLRATNVSQRFIERHSRAPFAVLGRRHCRCCFEAR